MSPVPPLATRYRARPDVLSRELDGEAVVLDLARGEYFRLNRTGCRVFELLDGERTLVGILDLLEGEFDAPRDVLEADLRALVADLAANGLISEVGPEGATSA